MAEDKLTGFLTPIASLNGEITVPEKIVEKDYEKLQNKPAINGVELSGSKTIEDLGEETLTNAEITQAVDKMFDLVFGGKNG